MTRKEANRIVKKLLDKYESNIKNPPLGKKYVECWNIHRKTPNSDYVDFDKTMRKEVIDLGIPLR